MCHSQHGYRKALVGMGFDEALCWRKRTYIL